MAARSAQAQRFYALVVPGIEDLAAAELRGTGARVAEPLRGFDKRESIVPFETRDARLAMKLHTLEDVFAVIADATTPVGVSSARAVGALITRDVFEAASLVHHAVHKKQYGRTFKVVARVAGRHAFRREDIERQASRSVAALLPRWREAKVAAIEVWVHVIGPRTIIGLRLSDDEMAQRSWKHAHVPASLKPTVAHALVLLTGPRPGDAFLDPMCGAGTILRERASSRAETILGGDLRREMLVAARMNNGRQPLLAHWDAARLPLPAASIDAIATNPPYGRQHDVPRGLGRLYAQATREMARVLKPGGRCVVLTGEPAVLLKALAPGLEVRSTRRLLVRGLPATAFVLVRT